MQCPLCTVPLYALPGVDPLPGHESECGRWAEIGGQMSEHTFIQWAEEFLAQA